MVPTVNTIVLILFIYLSIENGASNSIKEHNPDIIPNFYNGDYDYGYVEVRKGAFMFWWLYYAGGDEETANEKPLIIWLQGGPGIPASGVGNFMEMGPHDMNLQTRNSSWVHKRNVLFIDSPVGTGFSYVDDASLLVTTLDQAALDLVELTEEFLNKFPEFQTVPTHIFSQSFGGKIAPQFAYYLHKKIRSGAMNMNLKTVGLGSAYVSPKHFTLAYPDYLYNLGFIDQNERNLVKNYANEIATACNEHDYEEAVQKEFAMLTAVSGMTTLNPYNIIKKGMSPFGFEISGELEAFMNNNVKNALSDVVPANNVTWKFSNDKVESHLIGEFMKPTINFVEKLLNETNMNIAVYNGQLDIVTPIPGALKWMHRLKWCGATAFKEARRQVIPGDGNGYYKSHGKLSFWWIYKAGHSIPYDNPDAMEQILSETVDLEDVSSTNRCLLSICVN